MKGTAVSDHVGGSTPECQAVKFSLIDKHGALEAGSGLQTLKQSQGARPRAGLITLVVAAGRHCSLSTERSTDTKKKALERLMAVQQTSF